MKKLKFLIFIFILLNCESALCQKTSAFCKVLILGNSITVHGPASDIGWFGNWGMAASSEEKDYVHLLTQSLRKKYSEVNVKIYNVSSKFEKNYGNFDEKYFADIGNFNPDIVIVRLGENIQNDYAEKYPLDSALQTLVRVVTQSSPQVKVCITSRFWPNDFIDNKIRQSAISNHWVYVDLSNLALDKLNQSGAKFSNKGVGRHPSDLGMKRIKEMIWEKIKNF